MAKRVTDLVARIGAEVDARGWKSAEQSARAMERELQKLQDRQRMLAQAEFAAYREVETAARRREAAVREMARHEAAAYREIEEAQERQRAAQMEFASGAGMALVGGGAAIAAGLAVATRAAMDWESAWAGVVKVVDGSDEELAELEGALRELATTLPATHEEIAGVAAAAAQVGVARQDLAAFTETAIQLGTATNLGAEEAATGLAKLGNIMGTLPAETDRAGAALVALGNNGASTEDDILRMSLRLAGAGRQIGMTQAQIMGMANALSSVGIEAEMGGSAMSRVMVKIADAVNSGGDSLVGFATVAGMSGQQFAEAYGQDAAGAIAAFTTGLGRIQAEGGDTFAVLGSLGFEEVLIRDTLLRAAGAGEMVADSINLGSEAWKQNTALVDEAGRRYETAESKIAIARNQLTDLAIDLGAEILPSVAATAGNIAELAEMFGELPGPVREGIVVVGVLTTSVGVLGGAALLAIPKIVAMRETLEGMGARGQAVNRGLGSAAAALGGPWGIALAAGTVALGAYATQQLEARQRVDALADSLDEQTGVITGSTRALVIQRLQQDGALDAARSLGIGMEIVTDAALGNAEAIGIVNGRLDELTAGIDMNAVPGLEAFDEKTKGVAANARTLRGAVGDSNGEIAKAAQQHRNAAEAMGGAADKAGDVGTATKGAAGDVKDLGKESDDAAGNVDDLREALENLIDSAFGVESASDAYQSAILGIADQAGAIAEARAKIDEAGDERRDPSGDTPKERAKARADAKREEAEATRDLERAEIDLRDRMRDAVQNASDYITALIEQGATQEEVEAAAATMAEEIERSGRKAGLSAEDADRYADVLREIPKTATTEYFTPGAKTAEERAKDVARALRTIPESIEARVTIRTDGPAGLLNPNYGKPGQGLGVLRPQAPRGVPPLLSKQFADGGIEAFASGGVREQHVAQIAPAGAMRLWAEPETGGEAYIPLAPGKRDRSRAIADEVVARLGGTGTTWPGQQPVQQSAAAEPVVVRVPVQETHHRGASVHVGQVVTRDAESFVDWSAMVAGAS